MSAAQIYYLERWPTLAQRRLIVCFRLCGHCDRLVEQPVERGLPSRYVTAVGRVPNDVLPVDLFNASGLHPVKLKPLGRGIVREKLVGEVR